MQQENSSILRNQLDNTAGLGDLLLRKLADISGTDDDGDLRETALAKDLGVAEGEEVEDGGGVLLLALEVSLAGLGGDEGPELQNIVSNPSLLYIRCAPLEKEWNRTGDSAWCIGWVDLPCRCLS